jgi:hypothetical protein
MHGFGIGSRTLRTHKHTCYAHFASEVLSKEFFPDCGESVPWCSGSVIVHKTADPQPWGFFLWLLGFKPPWTLEVKYLTKEHVEEYRTIAIERFVEEQMRFGK